MNKAVKGFTLIELLVTISIIAILATIALVSYQVVIKNSRDARRQSDLRSIQSALEQYRTDQFYYPLGNGSTCADGKLAFNATFCSLNSGVTSKTYLNSVPVDPISSPSLQYCYVATPVTCANSASSNYCTSYALYAKLENPPSGVTTYGSGSCGSATDANPYNFKVTPP